MEILVSKLPPVFATRGVYGTAKNVMPERFMYLHPDAAKSLIQIEAEHTACFYYSDVFRSAQGSLAALAKGKGGAMPPGYSAHGYGFAVDLDVEKTLKMLKFKKWKYEDILEFMEERGWWCHRRDGMRGREEWHFNFLGERFGEWNSGVNHEKPATWSRAVEARIHDAYGEAFVLSKTAIQAGLSALGYYHGELDGKIGPRSKEAILAFQKSYAVRPTGEPDARTQRVLAFVTATVKVV